MTSQKFPTTTGHLFVNKRQLTGIIKEAVPGGGNFTGQTEPVEQFVTIGQVDVTARRRW